MTRWMSIVGARPQFVKLGPLCRALASDGRAREVEHLVVHTGQHYDFEMSEVFFRDLGIPAPHENLGVGSGSHAAQTAAMLAALEPLVRDARPDWVILYGDTNSTLAGALAAAKVPGVRLAHLEAGLRSFNRGMPEELNRVVADHASDLLLCPTETAMGNLRREGLGERAALTGDVMLDAYLAVRETLAHESDITDAWQDRDFGLATLHRQENTDDPVRLGGILSALEEVAATLCPVLLAMHPRTRKAVEARGWRARAVEIVRPLSYREMLLLETRARMILTDSGGVQKEAYFARRPCITLRDETEWVETLANRCNVLAGADPSRIVEAACRAADAGPWLPLYGDGHAAEATIRTIAGASVGAGRG